ncbi:hypothetical protein KKA87_06495 [bacterium]|nr:hypothetical protein [bacterium]
MKFYAYKGQAKLGDEKLGTSDRMIFELKTSKGAIRRCLKRFSFGDFRLYQIGEIYDISTYKEITFFQ